MYWSKVKYNILKYFKYFTVAPRQPYSHREALVQALYDCVFLSTLVRKNNLMNHCSMLTITVRIKNNGERCTYARKMSLLFFSVDRSQVLDMSNNASRKTVSVGWTYDRLRNTPRTTYDGKFFLRSSYSVDIFSS